MTGVDYWAAVGLYTVLHAGNTKWRPRSLQDAETRAKGEPSPAKRPRVDPAAGINDENQNYETSQTRNPEPNTRFGSPPLPFPGSARRQGMPLPSEGLDRSSGYPEEGVDTKPHGTTLSPQADHPTKDPTMEDLGVDHPMDGSFIESPARDDSVVTFPWWTL